MGYNKKEHSVLAKRVKSRSREKEQFFGDKETSESEEAEAHDVLGNALEDTVIEPEEGEQKL